MYDKRSFDKNKMILEGRIYPAIKTCVNNRYKILVGLFVYYGFILRFIYLPENFLKNINQLPIDLSLLNLIVTVVFTVFVLHNLINYILTSKEQKKFEKLDPKKSLKCPFWIELIYAIPTLSIIWIARRMIYDVWFISCG